MSMSYIAYSWIKLVQVSSIQKITQDFSPEISEY